MWSIGNLCALFRFAVAQLDFVPTIAKALALSIAVIGLTLCVPQAAKADFTLQYTGQPFDPARCVAKPDERVCLTGRITATLRFKGVLSSTFTGNIDTSTAPLYGFTFVSSMISGGGFQVPANWNVALTNGVITSWGVTAQLSPTPGSSPNCPTFTYIFTEKSNSNGPSGMDQFITTGTTKSRTCPGTPEYLGQNILMPGTWNIDNRTTNEAFLKVANPYKLESQENYANINLPSILASDPQLTTAAATGLVADNVSAGIVVFATTDGSTPVTIEAANGATILPFTSNFLTKVPTSGAKALTVPIGSLIHIGSFFYALALVQCPLVGMAVDYGTPIIIAAEQGSIRKQYNLNLVPPPVILVHGLWGDATSLSKIKAYLTSRQPWITRPALLSAIAYSPFLPFDADPTRDSTAPAAVLARQTAAFLSKLDAQGIVGSRVDIVAHSMGGLVSRYAASRSEYRTTRNRNLGWIHTIVTLDSPETGSALAPFLIANASRTRAASLASLAGAVWSAACGSTSKTFTVAQCFAKLGNPLARPGSPLTSGAVYALSPSGPSLSNRQLSPANIKDATWRAVTATAPKKGALAWGVNELIGALYKDTSSAPTVASILELPNDAIVTQKSQSAGANGRKQYAPLQSLSHTHTSPGLAIFLKTFGLTDANFLDNAGVDSLVCCWLLTASGPDSGAACASTAAAKVTQEIEARRSETLPAVDMPTPGPVDRLHIKFPEDLELAKSFEVDVTDAAWGLVGLHITQSDGLGHVIVNQDSPTHIAHGMIVAQVTPALVGKVTFNVSAVFKDLGVSLADISAEVKIPSGQPIKMLADQNFEDGKLYISARDNTAGYQLQPVAFYPDLTDRIELQDFATYQLINPGQPPSVRLKSGGIIVPLRPGEATVIVRFGESEAHIHVFVEAGD